jgi:outer membrane protein OmpA-like peptidoglycan-associated protein
MKYLTPLLFLCFNFSIALGQETNAPIIKKSIYFGGGSYYIDHEQIEDLKDWIENIEDPEMYEVLVHGHTDNIGSMEYNQWLSDMRTDMVIQRIKDNGIPEEFIIEKDFGEEQPVYDNRTWQGQRMNRRVDIVFKKLEM